MFEAPYPPYDPSDKNGFIYDTVIKRWPVILTQVIDHVYYTNHTLSLQLRDNVLNEEKKAEAEGKIAEGKEITEIISQVKYQMARDRALEPIPDDGEAFVDVYNRELDRLTQNGKGTWFTAPWLYTECYLYRLLRAFFSMRKHWNQHDPFVVVKNSTFKGSSHSIFQLAKTMSGFEETGGAPNDSEGLKIIFKEMIQMCLWGNATDLSFLTQMTVDDIDKLQSVGQKAQEAQKEFILRDDQESVWAYVQSLKLSRFDFVLDNSGFELFTDFVFADFLVTYTPYVSKVVFHPKEIPWFVSDVTPADFISALTNLLDPSFLPPSPTAQDRINLDIMVSRWKAYVADGTFSLSVDVESPLGKARMAQFWTAPWPFWDMKELAPDLWGMLRESDLVIVKGDLNYRKLTGDIKWPASTSLATAFGPLSGSFPILSLRTIKADVVVGIEEATAKKLDDTGEKWRNSGRYALISFLPA